MLFMWLRKLYAERSLVEDLMGLAWVVIGTIGIAYAIKIVYLLLFAEVVYDAV